MGTGGTDRLCSTVLDVVVLLGTVGTILSVGCLSEVVLSVQILSFSFPFSPRAVSSIIVHFIRGTECLYYKKRFMYSTKTLPSLIYFTMVF